MHEIAPSVKIGSEEYVIVPRKTYDRLTKLAEVAELPPMPRPDKRGNYPAVDYARASLARNILRERVKAGLTQKQLAKSAGIRVETLCRIETGKHTASVPTIERIDRALKRTASPARSRRPLQGRNE